MAEENNGAGDGGEQETETKTFTQAEVDAMVKGLKDKNAELLGETKAEREKREALERSAEEAETKRQAEQGEFKKLYEKTMADLEKERETNGAFKSQIKDRDTKAAATGIASELTRDTARAALLIKEAQSFVEIGEEGAPVFKIGGVEVDKPKVLDHLKAQYPFLVDGNQSNGGGAPGGNGGAGTPKRSEMNAQDKAKFINEHGQKAFLRLPK